MVVSVELAIKNCLIQVNLVDSALYECNWVNAPPRIKKLLLLYKIRLTKPNFIRGGPFIVCTQELFTDVSLKC